MIVAIMFNLIVSQHRAMLHLWLLGPQSPVMVFVTANNHGGKGSIRSIFGYVHIMKQRDPNSGVCF